MRGCLDQVGLCVCVGGGGVLTVKIGLERLSLKWWYHSLGVDPGLYEGEGGGC